MTKYNLIVYGASGFTGELICEYLSNHPECKDLSWAIAGRSKDKLVYLSNKYGVDCIIADSFNKVQLDEMCAATARVWLASGITYQSNFP